MQAMTDSSESVASSLSVFFTSKFKHLNKKQEVNKWVALPSIRSLIALGAGIDPEIRTDSMRSRVNFHLLAIKQQPKGLVWVF